MSRDQLRLQPDARNDPAARAAWPACAAHTTTRSTTTPGFTARSYATADVGLQWRWQEEWSFRFAGDYTWQEFSDAEDDATSTGAMVSVIYQPLQRRPRKERLTMDTDQASPEFSDYIHAIARRKALLFGIAIPIAVLAVLLAVDAAGHLHVLGAGRDRRSVERAVAHGRERPGRSYADQYVQNLKGIVLTDANLRKLNQTHYLYPDLADDESAMLTRLRRDIDVKIVTTPILDPRTGREREVVDAFTLSYDNRAPEKAQKGAQWLVAAFLAEHRRQRQGRASNAAEFYSGEAERLRTHVAKLEAKLAEFKRANYGQLPELTEVNMSMMDRAESQLAANNAQMATLRQERVFLAAQLEQTRAQGLDSGSVRQLEDQYARMRSSYDESHPDMIALRRQIDSLKYGTSAGAGTSLRSQLNQKRATLAEARQRYGAEHPDIKRLERDIATLDARIKGGERGDVEFSDNTPVGMQLRTQINAIDSQLGEPRRAERRAARETGRPREERDGRAAGRARVRESHARPDHRAREVRAVAEPHDGRGSQRGRHCWRPRGRIPADPVADAAVRARQAEPPGDTPDRPRRRRGPRPVRDRGRRSLRSEGARRPRRARAACRCRRSWRSRPSAIHVRAAAAPGGSPPPPPAAWWACGSYSPHSRVSCNPATERSKT